MRTVNLSQAWEHLGAASATVYGPVDRSSQNSDIREAYAGRVSVELQTGGAYFRVSPTVEEARQLAAAILTAAGAVEAAALS